MNTTTVQSQNTASEQLRTNAIHALWEVTNFVAAHTLITHGTGTEQNSILSALADIRDQLEDLTVRSE